MIVAEKEGVHLDWQIAEGNTRAHIIDEAEKIKNSKIKILIIVFISIMVGFLIYCLLAAGFALNASKHDSEREDIVKEYTNTCIVVELGVIIIAWVSIPGVNTKFKDFCKESIYFQNGICIGKTVVTSEGVISEFLTIKLETGQKFDLRSSYKSDEIEYGDKVIVVASSLDGEPEKIFRTNVMLHNKKNDTNDEVNMK